MNADCIIIDGVEYRPVNKSKGNRCVVVIDRGWLFAGDLEEKDGRISLRNVSWIFNFNKVGFAAVIADPTLADIRDFADINFPAASEIYRIPIKDDWGKYSAV